MRQTFQFFTQQIQATKFSSMIHKIPLLLESNSIFLDSSVLYMFRSLEICSSNQGDIRGNQIRNQADYFIEG